jgi:hypothetical protein
MNEPQGQAVPDAAETDPAALSSSEDLDEDRLRVDPLEEGIEPPERYTFSDRFGTTPSEEREGEPLDDRLRQEQPDIQPDKVPDRPIATTPADQLDESIDDAPADVEPVVPAEPVPQHPVPSQDENADKAGGSVAEAIRTPPEEPA